MYTCPTCRKPLFVNRPQNEATYTSRETSVEGPHAQQIGSGLDQPNTGRHAVDAGLFPNQTPNIDGISWRFNFYTMLYASLSLFFWLSGC